MQYSVFRVRCILFSDAPNPQPPRKLSNDLKVTEELNTIYMIHNQEGAPTIIDPNAKDEDGPAEENLNQKY